MRTNYYTASAFALTLLAPLAVNVRPAGAGECHNSWQTLGPGNWFDSSNWSNGIVPGPCDEVHIHNGGPVSLQSQSAEFYQLDVGVNSDIFQDAHLFISLGGGLTAVECEVDSFAEEATISLSGSGSEMNIIPFKGVFGEVYVGTYALGRLNVGNSATVNCVDLIVGENGGSVGNVSVTGAATINNSGGVYVGGGELISSGGGAGTMTIEIGGAVNTAGHGNIGNEEGGDGTVLVWHSGSAWNVDSDLRVGRDATGNLTVGSGGAVSNHIGAIGDLEGSTGIATVKDVGSTWTNSNNLYVGQAGDGTLNIEGGGAVSNQEALIANAADALGMATVTGDGSTWTSTGQLAVGKSGLGTLNINSGGQITSLFGRVGHEEGSTGEVQVTGAGSRWDNTDGENPDDLHVGLSGTGLVNVNSGGHVTSRDGTIGYGTTGIGFVDIVGSDSSWSVSRDLLIGVSGTGTLTLLNGGTLAMTGHDRIITLADASGSTGALNIGDGGPAGFVDAASVSGGNGFPLLVFDHTETDHHFTSDGTPDGAPVLIEGATVVKHIGSGTTTLAGSSAYAGGTAVRSGTLRVIGSIEQTTVPLIVGDENGDHGTFRITDGGSVTSHSSLIAAGSASTGHAQVTGPGSTWTSHDGNGFSHLTIGLDGTGSLDVNDQGLVTCSTGTLGSNLGAVGSAVVSGDGSEWSSDVLFVGSDGAGELTVHSGGKISCAGFLRLADNAGSTGTVNVGNGGSAGVISANNVNGGFGTATVNFNHTDNDYFFTRTGMAGGIAVPISGNTAVNHIGPGTTVLTGNQTYAGPTTVGNGTLLVAGEVGNSITTVNAGGTLGGSGLLNEVVVNGGTIAPGTNVGTLDVVALTLDADAVLDFELDGLAGPNDTINVDGLGDLVLDGTINITNLGGLEEGSYTVITYSGTLTDNGLRVGSAPDGLTFAIDTSTPGSVIVSVEPGAACPTDISDPTDGVVNVSDLLALLANWDTAGPGAELAEPYDTVNVSDLLQLLAAWGSCP